MNRSLGMLVAVLPAAAWLVVAGCSSGAGGTGTGKDGGPAADGSADSGGSGDAGGDGGAEATDSGAAGDAGGSSDGSTPGSGSGSVTILTRQAVNGVGSNFYSANAAFLALGTGGSGGCTPHTDGPCAIDVCSGGTSADAGAPVYQSAGAITITGGLAPNGSITLTPNANGTYKPAYGSAKLWNGGEMLTVTAVGAMVPMFTQQVTAPGFVTVTAPAFPAQGGTMMINRSQALQLTWTGTSSSGQVTFGIGWNDTQPGGTSGALSCSFAPSSGSGTIPKTSLAYLPATTAANVSVAVQNLQSFTAGNWNLAVNALTTANTPNGEATAQATIQ